MHMKGRHIPANCISPRTFCLTSCLPCYALKRSALLVALKKRDKLLDLFCGVGLLGISLALRMKAAKQDLSHLEGYEVYNQATDNARTNAGFLGLPKKKVTTFKSRDLSQPTLGARTNCDVAICGKASFVSCPWPIKC